MTLLRGEALHGADGSAVVAVLGVVVVLDDERAAPLRPAQTARRAARRDSTRARRPLVRRRQDQSVRVDALEGVDVDPVLADRDADDLEPGRPGGRDGIVVGARVLDREPRGARACAAPG